MSGILLPMIHTVDAVGDPIPVNVDAVTNLAKRDVTAPSGGATTYEIAFQMGDYPREIVWKYAEDDTARDADFAAVLVKVSVDVTP